MKKLKIIAGISWAFICLILIIILFPGLNSYSSSVAKLPFMKINPKYSGGEVVQQLIAEGCTLNIRKPVFDGLLKERKNGFIQMDWHGNIPQIICDTIDFDLDLEPDFAIFVNRNLSKIVLTPMKSKVLNLNISSPTSYGWAVRVNLEK